MRRGHHLDVVNIRLGAPGNSWAVSADLVDLRRQPAPPVPVTVLARPQALTLDLRPPAAALADGERIALGRRELTVLHTPGHSPDSLCCGRWRNRELAGERHG